MPNTLAVVAMFGWIPVVLALFAWLPARRAAIVAFLAAWLFLPMAGFKFAEGIPLYDKMSATCVGVMAAVMFFDWGRLWRLRPNWLDVPMVVWCLCPIASSLSNNLGLYDGLASAFRQTVTWGLPYFIGRLYFTDRDGMKELAVGLFMGGLIYVPLCLFEIRMSPQLHYWVYGYYQHSFAQTMRFGGWRPMVFMQHGLMVGMWMCMTGLIGWWLWRSGAIPKTWRRTKTFWLVMALLITAVWCKSAGAIVLLAVGAGVLWLSVKLNTRALAVCLILAGPAYCAVRGSGMWDGKALLQAASDSLGKDRADSLQTRMDNENALAAKAREQPAFGWGGWGRGRIYDDDGKDTSITDGLWIIALGGNGIVGLASLLLAMLLPAGMVLWQIPARAWQERECAPAIVLAVVLVLYGIDCIPNAMVNPIFMLVAGGAAGMTLEPVRAVRKALAPRPLAVSEILATRKTA